MINLVIDIGNSVSKLAVFDNREIKQIEYLDNLTESFLETVLANYPIENSILSSVSSTSTTFDNFLQASTNFSHFTSSSKSPISNHYKTPTTLGADRYAAVIGASTLFPSQNCLVIDAGTCVTYDFIDAEKNYNGGSISPGINMRFKAMNTFTGRLPLIEADARQVPEYGNDTSSSMQSGVQKGIIYEALGFINAYNSKWPDLKVVLCGGDVKFFESELKNSIFAHALQTEPHLVLIGLNEVIFTNND